MAPYECEHPMTVADLKGLQCDCGRSDCRLVFKPACHDAAPVYASWNPDRETIEIVCAQCGDPVAVIRVAPAVEH